MPEVDGKHYAYTEEGIAAAEKAKKKSVFTLKSGNTPLFKTMGSSPVKHNGSPQEGIPTKDDTEHNKWHANRDYIAGGGDPKFEKVWNPKKKMWERISKVTPPKTKEEKESFERAKTDTWKDDIKETERINP